MFLFMLMRNGLSPATTLTMESVDSATDFSTKTMEVFGFGVENARAVTVKVARTFLSAVFVKISFAGIAQASPNAVSARPSLVRAVLMTRVPISSRIASKIVQGVR